MFVCLSVFNDKGVCHCSHRVINGNEMGSGTNCSKPLTFQIVSIHLLYVVGSHFPLVSQ